MPKISASILACDFANLGPEIQAVETAGTDWIHLDIMDRHYVPNLTFGPPIISKIRPISDLFFDAHLMVENVDNHIDPMHEAGVNHITIHPSTTPDPIATLEHIKSLGLSAGVALNPDQNLDILGDKMLELVDLVLIMTVFPGFAGQSYIPQDDKIKALVNRLEKLGVRDRVLIEVDGGVNDKNAPQLAEIGVDVLVASKFIFQHKESDKYRAAINRLRGTSGI